MKKIRPYSAGWENLSVEERIDLWIDANSSKLGKRKDTFSNFLVNFDLSYGRLDKDSLEQLDYDLRKRENICYEFFTEDEKYLVRQAVFAIYNTTPALLELKMFNDRKERYRGN